MGELIKHTHSNRNVRSSITEAFNLFRRKEAPELLCAVPEDRAVPSFIVGETWEFSGKLSGDSGQQPGFDMSAASAGARYNGFYLFHTWNPCESHREHAA